MKPTLSISNFDLKDIWTRSTLGLNEFLSYLMKSDKFNIIYHDGKIQTGKMERSTTLIYNGKKIYVDFWDYAMPTYTDPIFNSDMDLIIKLQHPKMTFEEFKTKLTSKFQFPNATENEKFKFYNKIIPWTFFCSRMMQQFIGKEETIEPLPIKQLAFFCGKGWKCRGYLQRYIKPQGIEIIDSDQGGSLANKGLPSPGKTLTDEQYLEKMRTSKYGLVLHGRGSFISEAKNRREIDYMMLRKPLLLNYKPNYYNPLIEGKHYIYIDQNTDFKNIENLYNINEIAKNAFQWYKENASPEGVVNTFLQIMNERGFNEEKEKNIHP